MPNIVDSQQVEGLSNAQSVRVLPTIQATANSTLTLSLASSSVYIFTGTVAGQILRMGAANTYLAGHFYYIFNNSTVSLSIQDNSGALICILPANCQAFLNAQDVSTAAGIWNFSLDGNASDVFSLFELYDDFLWTTLGSGTNPYSVVSVLANGGTVAVEVATTLNDYFGRINLATGTTLNATGHAVLDFFNSVNKLRIASKRTYFEARVMVPVLSTAGVTYTVQIGLQDGNAFGAPVNGIYFTYTHGTNSGQWVGTSRSASVSTSVNSAAAVVINQWDKLRCEINAAGTSVSFYVNAILIGIVSTNIPLSTIGMRPIFQIDKGSSTATSSVLAADYFHIKMFR